MSVQSDRRRAAVLVAATFATLATARLAPAQQDFEVLINFDGTSGANPYGSLVQGLDASLYGTTASGGTSTNCKGLGCGTVFKVTRTGTLTGLYSFCAQYNCTDGNGPFAGLVQASDGNLYGTTEAGGSYQEGTVFETTPKGGRTTLYNFCAQTGCIEGAQPYGGLVQSIDGNFYGTTEAGGANGAGTVFKITPGGVLTTLYSFCSQANCTDGSYPYAGVIQATDGNLYGTASEGGVAGYGTVFKMTPQGSLTTLHSFDGTDGANPEAGLVEAVDGSLDGTTLGGGANGWGTVFEIAPTGTLTTLHSFCSRRNCTDGSFPYAGLVKATDGNFYGTASGGGDTGEGTIFKITPGGILTALHSFDGSDGAEPTASLVQATSGAFYGTTFYGGSNDSCRVDDGCGTVFGLSVGLPPFVETLPTARRAGAPVRILGTYLAAATSVTFNGVAATFKVVAPSEIETKVPSGATTGTVQVTTPSGTLSSNVPFRVLP